MEEPSEEESIQILTGLRPKYEQHHKVTITDDAVSAAVHLSARYISDRFLPDKAIDLIDESASRIRLQNFVEPPEIREMTEEIEKLEKQKELAVRSEEFERAGEIKKRQEKKQAKIDKVREKWEKDKRSRKLIVSESDIADVVSAWTKIPVQKLTEEENERLRKLESVLHERVVGQEEAVTRGAEGPAPAHRFLPVPGTHRRRKDGALQGSRRGDVRHGAGPDPRRYE